MRWAGMGCLGCGGLIGLVGLAAIVVAFIPGVINYSEQMTVAGSGGGLCAVSFLPLLLGLVLVVVGSMREGEG